MDTYQSLEKFLLNQYIDMPSIFSEGLACVSDGENYGFINVDGELVIPMKYPITGKEALGYETANIYEMAYKGIFKD